LSQSAASAIEKGLISKRRVSDTGNNQHRGGGQNLIKVLKGDSTLEKKGVNEKKGMGEGGGGPSEYPKGGATPYKAKENS